ncbi:hypothetical protein [Microbacterium sp.]|uniref:hypothetical protein n=1 Tax=Microbacterium sp. TaxID=51671 RepID=UPI003A95B2EA
MNVNDLLIGVRGELPMLPDEENPFLSTDALVGAQITRILVDVLGGTVGVLLELGQSTRLRGTTALLRVTGVVQQNWRSTPTANEFTAWSISGLTVQQRDDEFHVVIDCFPVGALLVVGAAADFTLLHAVAPDVAPPDDHFDPRALIRFGIADESTEVEPIGSARSAGGCC